MNGRSVNIYFQENLYSQLRQLTGTRQISRFVNEAVSEKLKREQQQAKEKLRKQLITDYQDAARDKDLRAEDEIWDETTGDGLNDE